MSKFTQTKPEGPSHRMLRVAELIRKAMAHILVRGVLQNPLLETYIITVPKVTVTPDLKWATIYILPLSGKDARGVVQILEQNRKALRALIAKAINLKTAPDVRFRVDDSFENADRIELLLNSERVQRDAQAS